ncbi:MAG: DVUA0089 family protein [Pseudomonadota bacterium]
MTNALTKRLGQTFGLALAAGAMTLPTAAHSATTLEFQGTVEANSIDYIFFQFGAGGGDLSIATNRFLPGPNFSLPYDPMIRLFVDDGSPIGALTGANVAFDDDSGPGLNSLITGSFGEGDYVLAVGSWLMTEAEGRSGVASTPIGDRDYRTVISTTNGFLSVPEPMTWMLMLLGMFGIGAAMRRAPKVQSVSVSYS